MSPRQSRPPKPAASDDKVVAYKHPAKRKNILPSGIEAQGKALRESVPPMRYGYNPHLPPVLRVSDDPAGTEVLHMAPGRALTDLC